MLLEFIFCFFLSENHKVCSPVETKCYVDAEHEYYADENAISKCGGCPTPCNQVVYESRVSDAALSNYAVAEYITNYPSYSEKYIRDNYSKLNIFFSRLSYQEVTSKEAYTPLALFCDIGGAMGLVLGSTILTIVEFLEFFARNIFFMFRLKQ